MVLFDYGPCTNKTMSSTPLFPGVVKRAYGYVVLAGRMQIREVFILLVGTVTSPVNCESPKHPPPRFEIGGEIKGRFKCDM